MRHLVLAAALLASGCASSGATTRAFPVGGFDRIASRGSFKVNVRSGAAPSVQASGDDSRLDQLTIVVKDGELQIANKKSWTSWLGAHGRVTIDIVVPGLRGATVTGSGDVTIDRVHTPAFTAALSGSGDLNVMAIEAEQVALRLTGSGDMTVAGRATSTTLAATGSGELHAGGLKVQDATIHAVGSGGVDATASRTATVSLTGSGDVKVAGSPRCTVAKRGSGSVSCG